MTAALFPPPDAPALLLDGKVMHARMKPRAHRFAYSVYALLIDLDRLAEANRLSRFFSVGRFNLLGFSPRDHGRAEADTADDPADDARRILKAAGLSAPVERILLLAYPRVLGFVFNPLSVYFAYGSGNDLLAVIYEVRNTFGGRHSYVEPVEPGQLSEAGLRQTATKLFHVSPFLGLPLTYAFRVRPPGSEGTSVRILETDAEGPVLSATFSGNALPLRDRTCLALFFRRPLMTLKVVFGIHFEALRLFLKGLRFHHEPPRPASASLHGQPLVVPRDLAAQGASRP